MSLADILEDCGLDLESELGPPDVEGCMREAVGRGAYERTRDDDGAGVDACPAEPCPGCDCAGPRVVSGDPPGYVLDTAWPEGEPGRMGRL